MRWVILLSLSLPFLAGCSSQPYKVAPVSGKVTLNGEPLAHAAVVFAPVATGDDHFPGPTAGGLTDSEGRYTLEITTPSGKKINGAVVGKHKVRITVVRDDVPPIDNRSKGPKQPQGKGGVRPKIAVPEGHKGKDMQLDCEVPPGGRDDANFDLKTP
jgi:hypothetical protein